MSICYVCGLKYKAGANPAYAGSRPTVQIKVDNYKVLAHKSCAKRYNESREPTARVVSTEWRGRYDG